MIKYYEGENFNELTKDKVLIDFFANWCGPCKMLGKVMEEIENDVNIDIVKIDTDKYPEIAREYKVMSIPTVILFENSNPVKENIGFMDKESLTNFIKEV